mmetsp:Transcript_28583/g.66230  ORF Transcript_28583/g.66230 Transcript_28583/m.66230 type:complete len:99 (+) Transcript_28583:604-900(+)
MHRCGVAARCGVCHPEAATLRQLGGGVKLLGYIEGTPHAPGKDSVDAEAALASAECTERQDRVMELGVGTTKLPPAGVDGRTSRQDWGVLAAGRRLKL